MSFEPSQMDRTNNYIRNRFLGHTADDFLDNAKAEENKWLQNNLNKLGRELNQRQLQAQGMINELINEAEKINIVKPADVQAEALSKRVQELKGVQQHLNQTLKKNQDILKIEEVRLNQLNAHLKKLQSDQKIARQCDFLYQGEMYCLGERATSRISGLPPRTSRDPQEPFFLKISKK